MRRHAPIISVLLLVLAVLALPAGVLGDDAKESAKTAGEVADEGDEEEDADEDADEPIRWLATFANGDAIRCRLVAFDRTALRFESAFAEGTVLAVPLTQVAQLERGESVESAAKTAEAIAAAPDRFDLTGGVTLPGKLLAFDATEVTAEVPTLGVVRLAWADLQAIRRASVDPQPYATRDAGLALLVTRGGDRLTGTVQAAADGSSVTIRSEALEARVTFDAVAVLFLPIASAEGAAKGDGEQEGDGEGDEGDGDGKEGEAADETGPASMTLVLDGELEIAVVDPTSDGEAITFRLGRGEPIRVPLARVTSMGFSEGASRLTGRRTILVWGAFSDRDQEYAWTRDLAKKHLEGFKFVETFTETFDSDFRKELFRSRALLIPEMEKWKHGTGERLAESLGPIVRAYLRAGGHIVVCGVSNSHTEFLRRAEIIDVTQKGGTADGQAVKPTTLGRVYFDGVKNGTFQAMNATHILQAGASMPGIAVYAEAPGGAVLIGRRVGRGMAFAIGSDFYQRTDEAGLVLANLLSPGRR